MLSLVLALALSAPSAADQERFKAFFTRGEALFEQGEFGPATWNFNQADAIRATPEVAYDLAKAHEKLKDEALALFYYRLYLKRAPTASDSLDIAERIGSSLSRAEVEGRGFLEITAFGVDDLTVDGKRFVEPPLAIFLAPGDYEVSATFPDGLKKMQVQIRTGKTSSSNFEPKPPPLVAVWGSEVPEEVIHEVAPNKPTSPLRLGAYASFGAGVALFTVGAILGALAVSDAGRSTDPSLRVRDAQGFADSANAKAPAASLLMGIGGAAAAAGTVMFVVSLPEPSRGAR